MTLPGGTLALCDRTANGPTMVTIPP